MEKNEGVLPMQNYFDISENDVLIPHDEVTQRFILLNISFRDKTIPENFEELNRNVKELSVLLDTYDLIEKLEKDVYYQIFALYKYVLYHNFDKDLFDSIWNLFYIFSRSSFTHRYDIVTKNLIPIFSNIIMNENFSLVGRASKALKILAQYAQRHLDSNNSLDEFRILCKDTNGKSLLTCLINRLDNDIKDKLSVCAFSGMENEKEINVKKDMLEFLLYFMSLNARFFSEKVIDTDKISRIADIISKHLYFSDSLILVAVNGLEYLTRVEVYQDYVISVFEMNGTYNRLYSFLYDNDFSDSLIKNKILSIFINCFQYNFDICKKCYIKYFKVHISDMMRDTKHYDQKLVLKIFIILLNNLKLLCQEDELIVESILESNFFKIILHSLENYSHQIKLELFCSLNHFLYLISPEVRLNFFSQYPYLFLTPFVLLKTELKRDEVRELLSLIKRAIETFQSASKLDEFIELVMEEYPYDIIQNITDSKDLYSKEMAVFILEALSQNM